MGNCNLSELSPLSSRFFTLPKGSKVPKNKWLEAAAALESIGPIEGMNVALVCGQDVIVLDVEGPKKTGSKNGIPVLSDLQDALGRLPMAPTYKTPSGGLGIIFRNPGRPIPKCDLGRTYGLEMRTGNHFCLLPPSTYQGEHYSGSYTWETTVSDVIESEGEIPALPEEWILWFLSMTCKETTEPSLEGHSSNPEHFEETVREWVWETSADIPRHDWFQVLAIIHRTGADDALKLATEWSQRNGSARFGAQTANQIRRYFADFPQREQQRLDRGEPMVGLTRLLEIMERHPMTKKTTASEVVAVSNRVESSALVITPIITSDLLMNAISLSKGIIRRLYDHVSSVSRDVPAFRIAAALSIVSACVQRTRTWPTANAPNLFTFLVGPSSTTKSFFLEFIKRYVASVESNFILPNVASEIMFQTEMVECPSRIFAEDELGKKIEDAYLRNRPAALEIINIMLKYYEQVDMHPMKRRVDSVSGVKLATLSLCGVSTLQSMRLMFANEQFHADGVASRFAYFVHSESLPLSADSKPKWEPIEDVVGALRRMVVASRDGLDPETGGIGYNPARLFEFGSIEAVRGSKQAWVDGLIAEEASMHADELEKLASMRSRHLALVDKYAVIHAMGCGRSEVTDEDAAFAIAMAKWNWETVRGDVLQIQTFEDRLSERVLATLHLHRVALSVREMRSSAGMRGILRHATVDQVRTACEHLAADGLVQIMVQARSVRYRAIIKGA